MRAVSQSHTKPGGNAVTTRTPSGRQQEESFSADSVLTSVKSMGESAKRKLGLMARAFNTKVKGSGVVPLGSQTQYRYEDWPNKVDACSSLPGDEGDDSEVVAFENQDGSSMQVRRAGGFGDDDDDSLGTPWFSFTSRCVQRIAVDRGGDPWPTLGKSPKKTCEVAQ